MTTIIKTAILSIATCLSLCVNAQVTIDETNFPDDILRQYVKGFDYDEDGMLSQREISYVMGFEHHPNDINNRIKNAKGIEHFTSLIYLGLHYEDITAIDLTALTRLEKLDVANCHLTEIDLSKNINLTDITINAKQLKKLDFSHNAKLDNVAIMSSDLTWYSKEDGYSSRTSRKYRSAVLPIQFNYNAPLSTIRINDVNINGSGIDYSKLINTVEISLCRNNLKQINITKCVKLKTFISEENEFTSIDVSHNPELTMLNINDANISTIDLRRNPKLKYLYCIESQITKLDVSELTQLEQLYCDFNQLTSLDVSKLSNLTKLNITGCPIPAIDLSNNPNIISLWGPGYIYASTPASEGFVIEGLDLSRVSNVTNGTLEGNRFIPSTTALWDDEYSMSYEYDTMSPNHLTLKVYIFFNKSTTPLDSITIDQQPNKVIKTVENGRMVIIRDGQKYDLTGRKI